MSGREKEVMLADPNQALVAYLDGLLAPVTTAPEAPASRPVTSSEPRVVPNPVSARRGDAVAEKPMRAPIRETVLRISDPQPVIEESLKGRELVPIRPAPERRGRPAWADGPFPCLLFRASGLTLAVPLVHLNGVMPWPEEITPMPGHRPWFLGLARHQQSQVKVVDTAAVVVPPERTRADSPDGEPSYGNVVLIDEGRWGLACEAVEEMITLDPAGIRWRTMAGKRPWLAGTVIEHMCALLDAPAFAEMLTTGER